MKRQKMEKEFKNKRKMIGGDKVKTRKWKDNADEFYVLRLE